LTEKQLQEEKPFIEVFTNNVKFELAESGGTQFNITFTNTKERIAYNFQHSEIIVFNDKTHSKYIAHIALPSDNVDRIIQKGHPVSAKKTLSTKFDEFKKIANRGLLMTSIKFYDELLDKHYNYDLIFEIEIKDDNFIINLEKPNFKKDITNYLKLNDLNINNSP
jgi:hypothetical protein